MRAALERIGESRLCFELNIRPKTLYRWKTGREHHLVIALREVDGGAITLGTEGAHVQQGVGH